MSKVIEAFKNHKNTIIFLHGLGDTNLGWYNNFLNIRSHFLNTKFVFPLAAERKISLQPKVPTRAWYDIKNLSEYTKNTDEGIEDSEEFLAMGIAHELQYIDPSNLILAGFSQGGAMALHMAYRSKIKVAGVCCFSGYLPRHKEFSDKMNVKNKSIPVLLLHGTQDLVVDYKYGSNIFFNIQKLAKLTKDFLQKNEIEVELVSFEEGHSVNNDMIERFKGFVKNTLKVN